jgi:hypothetical protein
MRHSLIKGLQAAVLFQRLGTCRNSTVALARIEASTLYLRGVRVARDSTIVLLRLSLMVGLIAVGMLLVHVAAFYLLPWSLRAKAYVGLGLGGLYALAGALVMAREIREQTWLKQSGALALIRQATGTT